MQLSVPATTSSTAAKTRLPVPRALWLVLAEGGVVISDGAVVICGSFQSWGAVQSVRAAATCRNGAHRPSRARAGTTVGGDRGPDHPHRMIRPAAPSRRLSRLDSP